MKIVERLLLEKPLIPHVYVVEYLLKYHPEDGKVAVDNMNPKKARPVTAPKKAAPVAAAEYASIFTLLQ